ALSVGDAAEQRRDTGRDVFNRVCAQCHRLGEIGSDVGPPLRQLTDNTPQQLLEAVLDPSREVDAKYASYTVLLDDGRVLAGIIRDESASQITSENAAVVE